MNDLSLLWTPAQTARILGISRSQIYNLLKRGELDSVRIGRSRRIAKRQLDEYVERLIEAM